LFPIFTPEKLEWWLKSFSSDFQKNSEKALARSTFYQLFLSWANAHFAVQFVP
jgi:hypothetical protein